MTSVDEEFDFIFKLSTLIRVMAMILVVLVVLIGVPSVEWSDHPPRGRKLIFHLHQYLGLKSVQRSIIMEFWRWRPYGTSNLVGPITYRRFLPLSFLLLFRLTRGRAPFYRHGFFGICIFFSSSEHFSKVNRESLF